MLRVLGLLVAAYLPAYSQSAVFDWVRQIGGSNGQAIAGIATDSAGNTYVAGNTASVDFPTQAAMQGGPAGSGLYRVDGPGGAWKNLGSSGFVQVSALVANPANPSTIYACGQPSLQRSADGGNTWTAIGSFPTAVTSIAVDASGGLYAATAGSGIFKSADGGATFSAVNNGIAPDEYGRLYFTAMWADPAQASVVFADQNMGLVRSADGGASWQPAGPLYGAPPVSLAFDRNTPGSVYAATPNGVLASTDDGQTWSAPHPLPQSSDTPLTAIVADPKVAGTLYGGALGSAPFGGLWKSTDNAQTWTLVLPASVSVLAGDPATGTLYAATGAGLLMSSDGFQDVTQIGPLSVPGINSLLPIGGHLFLGAKSSTDIFIMKMDANGNTVYATYFGGTSNDLARAMAVDSSGAVYVTGVTSSVDFPVSAGAFANKGTSFLFKLNADGSLAYSTYFTTASTPFALAVDGNGHAYVAGYSLGSLPTTPGAYETTLQGSYPSGFFLGPGPGPVTNAFLTEFDAAGASLVFSTYVGSLSAYAHVLALDQAGNAYLAGGGTLYKMSPDGSSLLATAAVNGTVWSLVVDGAGNLYAGGETGGSVATTAGAFQTARYSLGSLPGNVALTGGEAGFVTKFDNNFNVLNSTYLSGEVDDRVLAIGLAANGNLIAAGWTQSKAFPTRGPVQSSFANGTGFIAELAPDLSALVYSTFAGDTRQFVVRSVAATPDGGAMLAGATTNPPSFVEAGPVIGGTDSSDPNGPATQAFVVRVGQAPAMPRIDAVANAGSLLPVALSPGETLAVRGQGFGADAALLLDGIAMPLLSRSATTLTVVAPTDLATSGAAAVQVTSGGNSSNSVLVPLAQSAPGLFSSSGSGIGQGYILNADGTLNSPGNPAQEGGAITIFATGVGPVSLTDGFAVLSSTPNVFIDGFYADGIAAVYGPVTGLPGNVYQISVYIPRPSDYANVNPNLKGFVMPPQVAVTLQVSGADSQPGLALSVGQ